MDKRWRCIDSEPKCVRGLARLPGPDRRSRIHVCLISIRCSPTPPRRYRSRCLLTDSICYCIREWEMQSEFCCRVSSDMQSDRGVFQPSRIAEQKTCDTYSSP